MRDFKRNLRKTESVKYPNKDRNDKNKKRGKENKIKRIKENIKLNKKKIASAENRTRIFRLEGGNTAFVLQKLLMPKIVHANIYIYIYSFESKAESL